MSFQIPTSFTPFSGRDVLWVTASYLIGCFTAGYYWTRWKTGQDIRQMGSGNVGARNVGRQFGAGAFTVTALIDIVKGFAAVALAQQMGMPPDAVVATLIAVIVGHNWPLQLRFRGGKGVAVSIGALLALDYWTVICILGAFAGFFCVLRNFTLSGMVAFAVAPLAAFLCGFDKAEVAAMSGAAILVVLTHRKNIRQEIARMAGGSVEEAPIQMHKGSDNDEV